MLEIGIILAGTAAFCGYLQYRSIRNPLSIFGLVWMAIMIIHVVKYINYFDLNITTQLCLLLMVIGFFLGSVACFPPRNIKAAKFCERQLSEYFEFYKALKITLAIGIISIVLYVRENSVALNLNDFSRLDSTYSDFSAPLREFIHKIGLPFLVSVCVFSTALQARLMYSLSFSSLPREKIRDLANKFYILIALSAITLIVYDLISLKRVQTINIVISIFCAYTLTTRLRITVKKLIAVAFVMLAAVFIIYYVSSERNVADDGDIFKSWILYYTGPVAYFNSYIEQGAITKNYYGLTSIMGLLCFNLSPIAAIMDFPVGFNYYYDRQTTYMIGEYIQFNAFGTIMLDGYYDFGMTGVFLLSGFAGALITKMHAFGLNNSTAFGVCLSSLSFCWVVFLPIAWSGGLQTPFGQSPYTLAFVWLVLFAKRIKLRR